MRRSLSLRAVGTAAGVTSMLAVSAVALHPADGSAARSPSKPNQVSRGNGAVFGTTPGIVSRDLSGLPKAARDARVTGKGRRRLLEQGARIEDRSTATERRQSRTEHRSATRAESWKLLREGAADTLDAQPMPPDGVGDVFRVLDPYRVQLKLDPDAAGDGKAPKRGLYISSMPIAIPGDEDDPEDRGELADSTLVERDGRLEQRRAVREVSLPATAAGRATLDGTGVSVDLVDASQAGAATPTVEKKDAVAWYGEILPSVDLAVKALPTGFETLHQLRGSDAPENIDVPLTIPEDASVRLLSDQERDGKVSNTAAVVEQDDKTLVSISAPVATDADGLTVPVKLTVDGDQLRMTVEHRGADFKYPISVDPSYSQDFESLGSSANPTDPDGPYAGISNYTTRPGYLSATTGPAANSWGLHIGAVNASSGYFNGDFAGFSFLSQAEPTSPTTLHPQGGFIYQFNAYKVTYGAYPDVPNFPGPYEPLLMAGILNPNQTPYAQGGGVTAPQWYWDTFSPSGVDGPLVRNQRAVNSYWQIYARDAAGQSSPNSGTVGNAATFRLVKTRSSQEVYGYARLGWYGILASDRGNPFFTEHPGNHQQWLDRQVGTVPVRAHDYGYGIATFGIYDASSTLKDTKSVCNLGKLGRNQCSWDQATSLKVDKLPAGRAKYYGTVWDGTGFYGQQEWDLRIDDAKPTVEFDSSQAGKIYRPEGPAGALKTIRVQAADDASGIKTVEVTVNGQPVTVPQPSCTVDSCSKNLTYEIPTSAMAEGANVVKVKVKDQVTSSDTTVQARHTSDEKTQIVLVHHDGETNPPTQPPAGANFGRSAFGGLGFEDWWTYDTTETGAGGNLRVNLANGNTTWAYTPVENPGIGLNTFLRLTYNSFDTSGLLPGLLDPNATGVGAYAVAGRGFSAQIGGFTRLNEKLEIKGPGGLPLTPLVDPKDHATAIIFTDGDGTQHTFPRIQEPGTDKVRFQAPKGVELEFRRIATQIPQGADPFTARYWAATRPDGSTAYFNREGWLIEMRDRHDNGLVFDYENPAKNADGTPKWLDGGRQAPAGEIKPGCGFALVCDRRVFRVLDAAAVKPTVLNEDDLIGVNPSTVKDDRGWKLTYDASGRLTSVTDRKKLDATGKRRITTLGYDGNNRLATITEASNGPAAQQRATTLGYGVAAGTPNWSANTNYLTSVKVNNKTTRVDYGDREQTATQIPLITDLLQWLGAEREIRRPTVIKDRGNATDSSRTRAFKFEGADTFIRNGRGYVDQVTLDSRGRMTSLTEGVTKTNFSTATATTPRRSEQTWTDDNYVETSTTGLLGAGGTDATQAVTSEYCWGPLGQLHREYEHAGRTGATADAENKRTRTWSYRVHRGTQGSDGLDGTGAGTTSCGTQESGAEGGFVYDVLQENDRENGQTTYGYGPTPNRGDVVTLDRLDAGQETFEYTTRGLLKKHQTKIHAGPGTGFNVNEGAGDGQDDGLITESWAAFDGNGDAALRYDGRNKVWKTSYDTVGNPVGLADPRADTVQGVPVPQPEDALLRDATDPATALDTARQASLAKADDAPRAAAFVARRVYDALDRPILEVTPKRSDTKEKNAEGQDVDVADRFRVTATSYDLDDNVVATKDGNGFLNQRSYTPTEQLASETSPSFKHHQDATDTSANSDANPTLTSGVNDSEITSYSYDVEDNLTRRVDPLGSETGRRTEWKHDAFDQPDVQVRFGGTQPKVTSRLFDARGNVTAEADPKKNAANTTGDAVAARNALATLANRRRAFTYDAFDRLRSETENPGLAAGGTGENAGGSLLTTYRYDGEDRLKEKITPAGRKTTYKYDRRGALTEQYDPFVYTQTGAREARTDVNQMAFTKYTRRLDGQITAITSPRGTQTSETNDFTTKLSYTDTGELRRRLLPRATNDQYGADWQVDYMPNAVGDPETIKDARGNSFMNEFIDTGELAKTARPSFWFYDQEASQIRERTAKDPKPSQVDGNALPTEQGHGDFGKTTPQGLPDALPAKGSTSFGYDNELRLNRITSQGDSGSPITQNFTYDPMGRLTSRTVPFDSSIGRPTVELRWQYDKGGNLRAEIDGEGQAVVHRYDAYDRKARTTEPQNCQTLSTSCERPLTSFEYDLNDNLKKTTTPTASDTTASGAASTSGIREITAFDKADRVYTETDEAGARHEYEYDDDGLLKTEIRPRGLLAGATKADYATTFVRDGAGRVTSKTEKVKDNGASQLSTLLTTIEYDRNGNQTKVTSPGSAAASGGSEIMRVQERRYDGRDLPWATTIGTKGASDAHVTVTEYDGNGWLRRTIDAAGVTGTGQNARATYPDTTSNEPLQTEATRIAEVLQYDDDGLLTYRNLPWNVTQDKAATATDRKRYRQAFTYTPRGLPKIVTDVYNDGTGGGTPTATEPAVGRDQHRSETSYNQAGWATSTDEKNRVGGQLETDGLQLFYRYDGQGNQTRWSTQRGTSARRKIERSFYPSGQMQWRCGVRNSSGDEVGSEEQIYSYAYNSSGSLTRLTDWMHHQVSNQTENCRPKTTGDPELLPKRDTLIKRDKAGRPLTVNETWNGGKDTTYDYADRTPNLIQQVTVNGVLQADGTNKDATRTQFLYDELDRNTRITVTDPLQAGETTPKTRQTDLRWWPSGERRQITKPKTSNQSQTVEERFYDTAGLLAKRDVTPEGVVADKVSTTYTYDRNANRLTDERGTNAYNARDQLITWARKRKGTGDPTEKDPFREVTYTVDGNGRRTNTVETHKATQPGAGVVTTTTTTDNIYRGDELTRTQRTITAGEGGTASRSAVQTDCYSYNAFGSLTTARRQSTRFTTGTPTSGPSTACDSGGVPLGRTEVQNTYDTFERLTATAEREKSDPTKDLPTPNMRPTEAFCFDGLDRRDRRITGFATADDPGKTEDTTAQFQRARAACTKDQTDGNVSAYDYSYLGLTEQLTRENRGGGNIQTYDYAANGERLGRLKTPTTSGAPQWKNAEWRAYETDAVGSVIGLEDKATGRIATEDDEYRTDPFGDPVSPESGLSTDAKDNPFRFQGFYKDQATNTYDMQARAYRPDIGQFLQQDRFSDPKADLALASDPLTSSRYAFTAANPTTRAEWNGHVPKAASSVGDAAGAAGGWIAGTGSVPSAGPDPVQSAVNSVKSFVARLVKPEPPAAQLPNVNSRPKASEQSSATRRLSDPSAVQERAVTDPKFGFKFRNGDPNHQPKSFGDLLKALICDPQKDPLSCGLLFVGGIAGKTGKLGFEGVRALRASDEAATAAKGAFRGATKGSSRLEQASAAAFRAARSPGSIFVKDKHLANGGPGNFAKFSTPDICEAQRLTAEGLSSKGAMFVPNNRNDGTFRVIADLGRPIGTRGETRIRAVVTEDGRVINVFPVRNR